MTRRARGRYGLCDQTVTVYHRGDDGTISRAVHRRAFLDAQKVLNTARTGASEANGFLLVIPDDGSGVVPVAVGDKVLRGVGPEVATDAEWRAFVPSKVAGLVVVRSVDPKWMDGHLAHTEVGG